MPLPYITDFAVDDKYEYLNGFGNHIQSEAVPGAIPKVNNHPQHPPFDLRTEKISATAMGLARSSNMWSYLYRINSSYDHTSFEPYQHHLETFSPDQPYHFTPNSYNWSSFEIERGDWLSHRLLAGNGDARQKNGVAVWLFHLDKDMPPSTVFASLDGDALIIPQSGALDIQTEFGKLLIRQNEVAVIPRGIKYRVTLPGGNCSRGYVLELYEGHFKLPELGVIGTTGLAGERDFEVPTAFFEGAVQGHGESARVTADNRSDKWTIFSRLGTKMWMATQKSSPFDVVGWHGTLYPYKYDLKKFSYIGNLNFDHADPSIFVLFTVPAFGKEPGTSVVDVAVIGPRWNTPENTLWVPWFHRNTASEFVFPIVHNQDADCSYNRNDAFGPWGGWLNSNMVAHGSNDEEYRTWQEMDTSVPNKLQNGSITACNFETESSLLLCEWAFQAAQKNFKSQTDIAFES